MRPEELHLVVLEPRDHELRAAICRKAAEHGIQLLGLFGSDAVISAPNTKSAIKALRTACGWLDVINLHPDHAAAAEYDAWLPAWYAAAGPECIALADPQLLELSDASLRGPAQRAVFAHRLRAHLHECLEFVAGSTGDERHWHAAQNLGRHGLVDRIWRELQALDRLVLGESLAFADGSVFRLADRPSLQLQRDERAMMEWARLALERGTKVNAGRAQAAVDVLTARASLLSGNANEPAIDPVPAVSPRPATARELQALLAALDDPGPLSTSGDPYRWQAPLRLTTWAESCAGTPFPSPATEEEEFIL